jgi:UPF0176 protein
MYEGHAGDFRELPASKALRKVLRKMKPVKPILNISAYLFVSLTDTAALRESMRSQAGARQLKGTVLLAEEGINLFLAGPVEAVRSFLTWLQTDLRFAPLQVKESFTTTVPFQKLLVKVKPEIIRMNHPTIHPEASRAPSVDAKTVARWLRSGTDDAGQAVMMLDTRNAFEVAHGSFSGATHWNLSKFSDFPEAALRHAAELHGKTVVSYCTGGIRCEKAAIFMAQAGIQNVLQLDGGILKYFEDVGSEHFEGECFVFDEREALNGDLSATRT